MKTRPPFTGVTGLLMRALPALLAAAVSLHVLAAATDAHAAGRKRGAKVVYYLPLQHGEKLEVYQGNNQGPTHNDRYNRYGFDFSPMPVGTPVVAVADGVVTFVKQDTTGRTGNWKDNNLVAIRHADGNVSEYLHIKQNGAVVVKGQKVMRGDLIAYSGNTGNSAAPHLHFGLKRGSHLGDSVPCSFADTPGGVPDKGDIVTSKNFPRRFLKECGQIIAVEELFSLCSEVECFEPLGSMTKNISKIKIEMDLKVLKNALKKRDNTVELYKKLVADTLCRIKDARKSGNPAEAYRLACFAATDFNDSEKAGEFKTLFSEIKNELSDPPEISKGLMKFHSLFTRAVKKETAVRKRPKKGNRHIKQVVKSYKKALGYAETDKQKNAVGAHIKKLEEEIKSK